MPPMICAFYPAFTNRTRPGPTPAFPVRRCKHPAVPGTDEEARQ